MINKNGVWQMVQEMDNTPASEDLVTAFGETTGKLVYPDTEIQGHLLAMPRRIADRVNPTVWQALNRVQENIMRGGIPITRIDKKTGHRRLGKTRALGSVTKIIDANQKIFALAEALVARMGEFK
jgi:hypothetical protein